MATFAEFVAARGPALLRTAWLLTGSREDAEDLLQTALVSCYGRYDRIVRDGGSFEGYVRRALARAHVSAWRRTRHRPVTAPAPAPDESAEADTRIAVVAALALLPPRQRQVVVLRFYEGCSVRETATVMGCSRSIPCGSRARGGLAVDVGAPGHSPAPACWRSSSPASS